MRYYITADAKYTRDKEFQKKYAGLDIGDSSFCTGYPCWHMFADARGVKSFDSIEKAKEFFYQNEKYLGYGSEFKNVKIVQFVEEVIENIE